MGRRIAIIGGGIAGLSAGCYGRMNGYETEIFEMHTPRRAVCARDGSEKATPLTAACTG